MHCQLWTKMGEDKLKLYLNVERIDTKSNSKLVNYFDRINIDSSRRETITIRRSIEIIKNKSYTSMPRKYAFLQGSTTFGIVYAQFYRWQVAYLDQSTHVYSFGEKQALRIDRLSYAKKRKFSLLFLFRVNS